MNRNSYRMPDTFGKLAEIASVNPERAAELTAAVERALVALANGESDPAWTVWGEVAWAWERAHDGSLAAGLEETGWPLPWEVE